MPYVQRNNQALIIGSFANLQPGYAEEEIADDAAELLVFLNPPTDAIKSIQTEIQKALDQTARSHQYDDIKSACAYASPTPAVPEDNPNFAGCERFRTEGNALQAWMSLTWAMCYSYLATVQGGTNPMPTPSEAVAMMPAFTWPD
jgi:hypothetical protein